MAKDYLKEWWDEAGDYAEYEKISFGEYEHNPFENPEAYTVCMVIQGICGLLSKCELIDSNWNDEIELTEDNICRLKDEIDELSDDVGSVLIQTNLYSTMENKTQIKDVELPFFYGFYYTQYENDYDVDEAIEHEMDYRNSELGQATVYGDFEFDSNSYRNTIVECFVHTLENHLPDWVEYH